MTTHLLGNLSNFHPAFARLISLALTMIPSRLNVRKPHRVSSYIVRTGLEGLRIREIPLCLIGGRRARLSRADIRYFNSRPGNQGSVNGSSTVPMIEP